VKIVLKNLTEIDVISDPDAMMTEIEGKWRLTSCLFGWPKFLGCHPAFQGSRFWI